MSESKAVEFKTGVAALDELFQPVNRSDAPGLVVGVAQHGKTVYRRGFGLASIEHGVANTPATRMAMGSSSKHFTSLALLLLAEEGRVDVDASVRRYLPELPVLSGEPSLRQLMSHTGGHRCYADIGFLSDGMAIKPEGAALAAQVRQTGVNFAPGEKMIYSNGGYHLLSLVIARVSGQSFEAFLKERIFTPIGMPDTESMRSDFEIHRGMATLHVPQADGRWRRGIFPSEETSGDGATITTVDDVLRWLAHLRAPQKVVGSAASWAQMLSPARLNSGLVDTYGLGLLRHDYRGVEVVHHGGGVIGGRCQMLTVPSQALDIIIMSNGAPVDPIALAYQVIDQMLGDDVLGPPREKASAARFKPMLGTRYHAPASGLVFGFAEAAEGKLGLSFMNQPPMPLWDMGLVLRLGFEDMTIGPLELRAEALAGEGQPAPALLVMSESGHAVRCERLPDVPPPLAVAGAALLGRYRAADLDAEAVVSFAGERLQLRVQGAYGSTLMDLEAFSSEVFGWQMPDVNLPLRGVLSLQRQDGRVTGFHVDTPRTRQMAFERLSA
ncbi:serine hydrolase domain-containing protein [Roseateles toxinivorans]|uniref:CubicO group peptidase (Beta-lactamase class C family) n=1 Tax=Roseateles toxinivorans TaxID=270368 RepID=A0A4R6QQL3_9BURK|nr:serine hydrolase domain-containing protein [Roseateles toxinivorans]TDP73023.1 CubicO group peptidase (beta-lactamase class C family) [Roseateles toxinivorans]